MDAFVQEQLQAIWNYFPELSEHQKELSAQLYPLYEEWNAAINVISRKDMVNFYERHVLHSLGIAKAISFADGTRVLDVGTGGGFPGIPLAIYFPKTHFHLIDPIGKKIKVVKEVVRALGLENVSAEQARAENLMGKYDFAVSRAVTRLPEITEWLRGKISGHSKNLLPNGLIYLKGGDIKDELRETQCANQVWELSDFFGEEFFETKKIAWIRLGG